MEDSWSEWLEDSKSPTYLSELLFGVENWLGFSNDAASFSDIPVDDTTVQAEWVIWATAGCNTLLAFLTIVILAGISLPQAERLHQALSSHAFATLFLITLGLNWLCLVAFLAGTSVLVDSCMSGSTGNGPSEVVQHLLGNMASESQLPQYWSYFSDGCPAESYPSFVDDRVWEWGSYLPSAFRLANEAKIFPDFEFVQECGAELGVVRNSTKILSEQFCKVTQSLIDVRRQMGCDKWYPWYELIVNESYCNQGATALTWAITTQFSCVLMGLIIWTFRASFRGEKRIASEDS